MNLITIPKIFAGIMALILVVGVLGGIIFLISWFILTAITGNMIIGSILALCVTIGLLYGFINNKRNVLD